MGAEPQVQGRWEEQLAGYVSASFRVLNLGNVGSQAIQFINKMIMAALLFFGAKLVIEGSLTVGEFVAFNMLAGRVSAPVPPPAALSQDFHPSQPSSSRVGQLPHSPAWPFYSWTQSPPPAS